MSDLRWMASAIALSERGRAHSYPNPNVGCVLVNDGRVVGRGWTQAGGRPHAEAMAIAQARERAKGATAYVTLEPCAEQGRGPACADGLIKAGIARVIAATGDPFPGVNGKGFSRLRNAGIDVVEGVGAADAQRAMAGFLLRQRLNRPHVTLKLALSLDGAVALSSGESRWITGPVARSHAHLLRARSDAILVGRGTFDADAPQLDVRLPGLESRSPRRVLLSSQSRSDADWTYISAPSEISALSANWLLVEGGMQAAAAFLAADLVDTLIIYTAPIVIGGGKTLGDIGLGAMANAHGRWARTQSLFLGTDRLDVYERIRG